MNSLDDPVILGKAYYPQNILIKHQDHLIAIYDEFLTLEPVKGLLALLKETPEEIFPYNCKLI